MNRLNLAKIYRKLPVLVKKHTPEILTSIGLAGMIAGGIMAVKVTPKAMILMETKKEELDVEVLSNTEKIKTSWTCYIPSIVICSASIACILGATSVTARRGAALATAYTLSESALKGYQEKVVETLGDTKDREIKDAIAKDIVSDNPISSREVFVTQKGDILCYDVISGRYFKSDMVNIEKCVNELNKQMLEHMYISLNDFYYEIGLSNISIGEDIGWNIKDGLIDLSFSSQLTENGTPCIVLDYHAKPNYDFY